MNNSEFRSTWSKPLLLLWGRALRVVFRNCRGLSPMPPNSSWARRTSSLDSDQNHFLLINVFLSPNSSANNSEGISAKSMESLKNFRILNNNFIVFIFITYKFCIFIQNLFTKTKDFNRKCLTYLLLNNKTVIFFHYIIILPPTTRNVDQI